MKFIKNTFTVLFVLFSLSVFANERSTVSQTQLLSLQNAPLAPAFTLLDVRSIEEYQAGHIKGAVNISHSTLKQNFSRLTQDKDETIIVYCRSGRRAGIAEELLKAQGYTQVKHLSGDMNGWLENNQPTVSQ